MKCPKCGEEMKEGTLTFSAKTEYGSYVSWGGKTILIPTYLLRGF